jgi:hypothetical protein
MVAYRRRVAAVAGRALRAARGWIETTENLIHLVVLILVPLLLATVTWLSNITPFVSFLVYPPLASGTYTLFADPEGRYAEPRKFVGGMTLGALCGWVSLEITARYWYLVPPEQFQVHAGATALSIFLTGLSTWLLDLEVPTAFSAALLVLVSGSEQLVYVVGIAVSSAIVAGAFAFWYDRFYEHRAQYLFQTVKSDDRVLVPIRDPDRDEETALFAAYLAAAHEAGKVVLYQAVSPEETAAPSQEGESNEQTQIESRSGSLLFDTGPDIEPPESLSPDLLEQLQSIERTIEESVEVPCEMVITEADPADPRPVLETARTVDCDLVVSRYDYQELEREGPTSFLAGLFRGGIDVIGFHSAERQTSWSRILVLVKTADELSHAMLDFANRLATATANVSVCRCISDPSERNRAESMLHDLVSSFQAQFETRVSYGNVPEFLRRYGRNYDLAIVGASSERSTASKVLSPPTFVDLEDVECDVAIVHRA